MKRTSFGWYGADADEIVLTYQYASDVNVVIDIDGNIGPQRYDAPPVTITEYNDDDARKVVDWKTGTFSNKIKNTKLTGPFKLYYFNATHSIFNSGILVKGDTSL